MNKTKKASLFASAAHAFYEANSIPEDVKPQLEVAAKLLIGARRRSTEEAFECGEHFEKVAVLLPEGTLEKWAVECCGYTARHVRTQRSVHRNLGPYKAELIELAVGSTVLGKLSAATPEQIEQAIGFAGIHGRLRVQDVTAIIAGSKEDLDEKPELDPYDAGGLDGLKAIIAIKVREGLKSFVTHLEEIRTHVDEALTKKNIVKKALADKTALTARLARCELESLAQFVLPNSRAAYVIDKSPLPVGSKWAKFAALLYKMGSDTTWPDKTELRTWLETEVVPMVDWATSKTASLTRPEGKAVVVAHETVSAEVVAEDLPPSEALSTVKTKALISPWLEENLAGLTEGFTSIMTGDFQMPSSSDDAIPSVAEALAKTGKRFQRPEFLDKIKRTSPPSAAA